MTGLAVVLVVLAALDGMLSGFRSAAGRDGRIRTTRRDGIAQARGLLVVTVLLLPAAVLGATGLAGERHEAWRRAAEVLVASYLPFGLLVLLALLAYATAGWERRFLAQAAILGPGTFLRPAVAVLGGAWAVVRADDPQVTLGVVAAVAAVLAVAPVCDRLWYDRVTPPPGAVGPLS